jgi:hypothetical protein
MAHDEPKKFGEFVGRLANPGVSVPPEDPLDSSKWADGFQKDAERYFLPQKIKKLEVELSAIKASRITKTINKRCLLSQIVGRLKRDNPQKSSDHSSLALGVDNYLARKKKELKDICPKPWLRMEGLPRLFAEALKHPKFKNRAKQLISKAQ